MQKLLIIDGNYFSNRVLGQVNMNGSVNNLNSETEINSFKTALKNSLVNIWCTFNNEKHQLIDQMIFVSDYFSWRKKVTPYRPYYLKDDTERVIGYKEQRIEKKKESPINYDNFYQIYNEFVFELEQENICPVFKIQDLEGDDEITLLVDKLSKNSDTFSTVFATDGDLNQIVRNNVVMMKNIRSKSAPNGEYIITLPLYTQVFEQNTIDVLLSNSFDVQYYKELFSIQIGAVNGENTIHRELHAGIELAKPFKTALVKSIAGDPKDNIFSIISWKSSTGTRQYSLTEKYIEKALAKHGYSLTEENCRKILSSKETLYNMLLSLREVSKQEDVDIDEIGHHLKHNMKMNILSVKNIPEDLRQQFDELWNKQEDFILNQQLDENKLKKLKVFSNNNGTVNVLEQSLPVEFL